MPINIEQGAANPSIGILLRLSDALGVGLSALVDAPQPSAVKVTREGTGPVLWSGPAGGRAVAHAAGPHELLQVPQGAVVIEIADQTVELQTGDALSFPSDVLHAYGNLNSVVARFTLSVFEPAVGVRVRGGTTHA